MKTPGRRRGTVNSRISRTGAALVNLLLVVAGIRLKGPLDLCHGAGDAVDAS
jgi:hypothetical protein